MVQGRPGSGRTPHENLETRHRRALYRIKREGIRKAANPPDRPGNVEFGLTVGKREEKSLTKSEIAMRKACIGRPQSAQGAELINAA